MGRSTTSFSARPATVRRGASRIPRTSKEIVNIEPVASRASQATQKIGFSVIQHVDMHSRPEYDSWQNYADAFRIINKQFLSSSKDVGGLAITLVNFKEISSAVSPSIASSAPEKQKKYYDKIRHNLNDFLLSMPILHSTEEDENLSGGYSYRIMSKPEVLTGQQVIGHTLVSRLLPRLRGQVLNFLEDRFSLDINADPSSAGLDNRIGLWQIRDEIKIEDIKLKQVDEGYKMPGTISMHRPEID